jgi:hypothetical protein
MIFIGLLIWGVYLYIRGYKVFSLLILCFFVTSGYYLVPEESMNLGFMSKGMDYALIQLALMLFVDSLCIKNYYKIDTFVKVGIIFFVFLIICIFWSKYKIGLEWKEIIRTCRYQFFWLLYFVLRQMKTEEIKKTLDCLYYITLFLSILYLCQQITRNNILNDGQISTARFMGIGFLRFYNHPDPLYFFIFYTLYKNPIQNIGKRIASFILILAFLAAFHRSWTGFFFLALALGYFLQQSRMTKIKIFTISLIVFIPLLFVTGNRFMQSRTYEDFQKMSAGLKNVDEEVDWEDFNGATFTYRLIHLYERMLYLSENPVDQIIGAGLIPEDSKLVDKLFDFKIGLIQEATGGVDQIDTGDISYSILFLRMGYVGTALYFMLYLYMIFFFYKNRNNRYAHIGFLFLILTLGASFFSANLLKAITYILPLMSLVITQKENQAGIPEEDQLKTLQP